jgi:hypothetical protein
MRTIKILKMATLTLLIGLGFSPAAGAADVVYHGALCNQSVANDPGLINFNQFGVHNSSASPLSIACGAAPTKSTTVNEVDVVMYDRDPNTDVSCTLLLTDASGNVTFSQVQATAGSGAAAQSKSFFPRVATSGSQVLFCSIPPQTSAGFSHVTTYRVQTSP